MRIDDRKRKLDVLAGVSRALYLKKKRCGPGLRQRLFGVLILNVTFCHLSAVHCASMDSLRTDNLDVRHPITAEVILNVFDKRLLVPSQPLGIVA